MCHRISPLLIEELKAAMRERDQSGRATLPQRDPSVDVPDAYPGRQVPLLMPDPEGRLEPVALTWGFEGPSGSRSKTVFNTRIETALAHARSGRGMWAHAILCGRCLVPVRGFYEWATRAPRDGRKEVRFVLPGHAVFLLAGICEKDRFSVITTEPNADVSAVHSRMPLVLGPGESSTWLGPDFARLQDRSGLRLVAGP